MTREHTNMYSTENRRLASLHRRIATAYAKELAKDRRVEGIVLLGGAARGYADKYSDVDLALFVTEVLPTIPKRRGGHRRHGLDIMVMDVSAEEAKEWSDEQRQAYSEGKILFDRNGRIQRLLELKLRYSKEERRRALVEGIMALSSDGIDPPFPSPWRGWTIEHYLNIWILRGSPFCAHVALNYDINLFLQILYAYNRCFVPDEKWRLFRAFELPWMPKAFGTRLPRALRVRNFSKREYKLRRRALVNLYHQLLARVEEEGALPADIRRYYLRHRPEYALHPEAMAGDTQA